MSGRSAENDRVHRTRLLLGDAGLQRLARAHVAVFGVGGVGSYAVEALCRAGIGRLTLVDSDRIIPSNINRQLHALADTVGALKVAEMAERCRRINPDIIVSACPLRFDQDSAERLLAPSYDFVVDAIDSLSPKVLLLEKCARQGLPLISSMGAAGKLSATQVTVGDLFASRHCPLARLVRKRLRRRGITGGITAVYSAEMPILPPADAGDREPADRDGGSSPKGTISYMPAIFGLHCAGFVIEKLLQDMPARRRGLTLRTAARPESK